MIESYVPIAHVEQLLIEAKREGCDLEQILHQVDLDQHSLKQKKEVSARQYGEIYRLIMIATQNEWFGMFSGGRVPLGSFRLMSLIALQSENLQQAIYRAGDFSDVCRGMNNRFFVERAATVTTLTLAPVRSISARSFNEQLAAAKPESVLTWLFSWYRFMEWLIDKEIPLQRVTLTSAEKDIHIPLVHADLSNIEFGADSVSMSFSSVFLDQTILRNQAELSEFLRTAPYHLVTQNHSHTSTAAKVRAILNRDVSDSMPSAEQVAAQLNVSVSTLRRMLSKETTSFQKLKDDIRKVAAFRYLEYAELSNAEIADRLGFDEPSAFFRCFKKWTGITPGQFRDNLR